MAKASYQDTSDGEGRRLGEQTGLDTRVVLAVNYADLALHLLRANAVSKGSRLVCHLGSTVARLKLKGIGGGAPQAVDAAVQLDSTPGNSPGKTAE